MAARELEGFGGLKIAADDFGSQHEPSVLLIPGGGQSRKVWQQTARALAEAGRHVITLDLRGHGESEWASDKRYDLTSLVGDLHAVLRQLSSRPVIVGASLGGWIAATAIGEGGPDLATGLILVDSPAHVDAKGAASLGALLRQAAEEGCATGFDPAFAEAVDLEEMERRMSAAIGDIRLPTLFVRGERSHISTSDDIVALAQNIADSEVVEVANAGHLVAVDQADTFNALLVEFLERRVPRSPPEFVAGSDPRTLRDALGCFATGVTVVTAKARDGTRVGLTANSFTSVSMDPPLLLVCPARSAGSMRVLHDAEHFAVNVLHIGQQGVSNIFATGKGDRFAQAECEEWETGAPIVSNSLASFECRKYAEYDGGDHVILVGEVTRVRFAPQRDPLLYFRGKYRRLHFA
jgi:flavin reductase (DIM6/NTAB) family NADH-FMN oxidoreductase RutF/pimeloyl-ACP methyl ester carboxylesterase